MYTYYIFILQMAMTMHLLILQAVMRMMFLESQVDHATCLKLKFPLPNNDS